MAEKKLLGAGSLSTDIKNLLDVESPKQYNVDLVDLMIDLRRQSKKISNTTTMQLYHALDDFNINIKYSPHDEFLAVNDQGIISTIKPKSLTTAIKKQGRKIITRYAANNLEETLQSGQEKATNLQIDNQKKQQTYIKLLLKALSKIDISSSLNERIYNYVWKNKDTLIREEILFTIPHENKSLVGTYAFDKEQTNHSVDRINYDTYLGDYGRMIGFGPKTLHSTSDFYMFNKHSLKKVLQKKLQILAQK